MNTFNYKNRGMLLEKLVNNTINFYIKNKIAFFAKKGLDIKFKSVNNYNENKLSISDAFISSKSTVDYYGVYKGKYVSFEAKSTDENVFYTKNVKDHQHNHLKFIDSLGAKAFYLIMFKKFSKIFIVDVNDFNISKNSYSYEEALKNWRPLDIVFPGIVDFLELI